MKNNPNAAFDTYDPSLAVNRFDPSLANKWNSANGGGGGNSTPASVLVAAQPGQKMQINLVMLNPTASTLTAELFYYLNSAIRTQNLAYAVGHYLYIPLLSYEGIAAIFAGAHGGTIGFDKTGTLVVQGDPTVPDPNMTVKCKEISYNGFFNASATLPFTITFIRMTTVTDPQIDEQINYIKKSFSGGVNQNPTDPRSFFKPSQFQSFIVDITVSFDIGIDTGLQTLILPGENVRYALFINLWTNQTLM
jgi:hypothetical protein